MIHHDDIHDLLVKWGQKALQERIGIGYGIGVLGKLKGSTVKSASITDSEYEKVDRIISGLKNDEAVLHDVAGCLYILRMTHRQLSRDLKCSNSTVQQYKRSIIDHVSREWNLTE